MTADATAEEVLDAAVKEGPSATSNALPSAPKPTHPVIVLVKAMRTLYDFVHYGGKAYAVPRGADATSKSRANRGPYHGRPVPGVAVPFGAALRRQVVLLGNNFPSLPPVTAGLADTVLLHLEGRAFAGPETKLALRFHQQADRVCVDLGRQDGKALVITPEGWEVATAPDVVFRRSHATKPLPEPSRGGTLAELAELLALDPDSEVFRCLFGWLVGLPFVSSVRDRKSVV